MTFPAILKATENPLAGLAALAIGVIAALIKEDLFITAIACVAAVLVVGFF